MRNNKYLAILTVVSILIGVLSGCQTSTTTNDDTVFLAGFETYDELINFRWLNHFGSVKLTTDMNYVTQGKSAIQIEVNGDYKTNLKPSIGIAVGNDKIKKDDFTDIDMFLLDVYNDNDFEANINLQYLTAAEPENKLSSEVKYTIPAKTKKTAEFSINRDFTSQLLNIGKVLQIRITFDNATKYGEEYRKFFIDNLRCIKTIEPIDDTFSIRNENELESADKADYLAVWSNINKYQYTPSSISFNEDPKYIKQGTGSFKITNVIGSHLTPTYGAGWKTIPFIKDISQYSSIRYWLYNDGDMPIRLSMYNGRDDAYIFLGEIPVKKWKEVVIKTSLLKQNSYKLNDFKSFQFVFEFPTDRLCSIYFDDLRCFK